MMQSACHAGTGYFCHLLFSFGVILGDSFKFLVLFMYFQSCQNFLGGILQNFWNLEYSIIFFHLSLNLKFVCLYCCFLISRLRLLLGLSIEILCWVLFFLRFCLRLLLESWYYWSPPACGYAICEKSSLAKYLHQW